MNNLNSRALQRPPRPATTSKKDYLLQRIKHIQYCIQHSSGYQCHEINNLWDELNELSQKYEKLIKSE